MPHALVYSQSRYPPVQPFLPAEAVFSGLFLDSQTVTWSTGYSLDNHLSAPIGCCEAWAMSLGRGALLRDSDHPACLCSPARSDKMR